MQIFTRLYEKNPFPTTELNFTSPFELLISVLLSAQSTDIAVNKATAKLYAVANTPSTLLALGVDGIKEYIKTIGIFNNKAKNIVKICHILIEKYNSKVPENREALESLPGVGRKTANVILNIAFNRSIIAVDTHVFRVSNRIGLAPGKNVKEVEEKLTKKVPLIFKINCNNWLVLHGRYICTARKPHCTKCLIEDLCEYNAKIQI